MVQTISLPNVKGRLDHMDVDVKGKRLFVAGLENGTFEVVDLQAGKWVRSFPDSRSRKGRCSSRNSISYLWQAAMTGCSESFEGTRSNFSIRFILSSDRIASSMNRSPSLFTSAMAARMRGKDYGEIGIIDAQNDKVVGDIKVVAHPSELLLDKAWERRCLFSFPSPINSR